MRTRSWMILLCVIFGLQFVAVEKAHACSGGPDTANIAVNPGIVVVRANMLRNHGPGRGDIWVTRYLVGEPGLALLQITEFDAGQVKAELMHYVMRCYTFYKQLPAVGHAAIFFLSPRLDGTYVAQSILDFSNPDHPPRIRDDDSPDLTREITEQELLEHIQADPRPPIDAPDAGFVRGPLAAPLLIVDQTDNAYMIPANVLQPQDRIHVASDVLDVQSSGSTIGFTTRNEMILYNRWSGNQWKLPWPSGVDCQATRCFEFSPDGLLLAKKTSPMSFELCELGIAVSTRPSTTIDHFCQRYYSAIQFTGHGFHFSPDSETIAVWHNDSINIFRWGEDVRRAIKDNTIPLIASIAIQPATTEHDQRPLAEMAVWSQDSRWLAYSDGAGLWLWDVFTQNPRHIMEAAVGATAIPYARWFSPSGRYLAVTQGNSNMVVDLQSSLVLPDGVINREERSLLRMDTVDDTPVPAEECSLLDGTCQPICPDAPVAITTLAATWESVTQREYRNLVLCVGETCGYRNCEAANDREREIQPIQAYRFANLDGVTVLDDFVLRFRWIQSDFDFEGYITAPIDAIYWLPMPFEKITTTPSAI